MREFGANLQALMKSRKLSARLLAKELHLSQKTVADWVGAGGSVPRDPALIKKLADYFEVTTHSLLFGEEDPRSSLGAILDKTEIHTGLYEISIKKVRAK